MTAFRFFLAMVLAPYLSYTSYKANGDVRVLLLGNMRGDS
jgi:hypothetical protein